jgi:hypothetical protein
MKLPQSTLPPQPRSWPAELTPQQAKEFMQEKIARLMAQAPQYRYAEKNSEHS